MLVYNESKSFIRPEARSACNARDGYRVQREPDTFHLGPDAKIHFSDTHTAIEGGLEDFCVEQLYEDEMDYEYEEGADYG